MRLSRQFQACLFFLQKDFAHTKITKTQTSDFLRSLYAQKIVAFVVSCLLNFVLLVNVCL